MTDVLPCITSGARITSAPNAWPMHCIPRHTPKMGTSPLSVASRSLLTPASSGVPGPGLISIPSGCSVRTSSAVTASCR